MTDQELTVVLIELIALLIPVTALSLRLTISDIGEIEQSLLGFPVRDIVLMGGGFSICFLLGTAIILVRNLRQTAGYSVDTPLGLALTLLIGALVVLGCSIVVLLWGVLIAGIED